MKILPLKNIIFLPLLLALTACKKDVNELTLADISQHPLSHQQTESISAERLHAIEHYQSYLNNTEFKTHNAEALRRVADLELEISEENKNRDSIAAEEYRQAIMLSSIEHYNTYLKTYAGHEKNDLILYQLAKAYSLTGDMDKALETMDRLASEYPASRHIDEIQFRRGEMLFVFQDYPQAEQAYANIVTQHKQSPFYEKALYKMGWSQFKQSKYKETLASYFSLLDIKEKEKKINQYGIANSVSRSERDFITDSLRVISLSLSYQKGYKTIDMIFSNIPKKLYEPLIYKQLGKLYAKKERFNDAAETYMAFTERHPLNPLSPGFHTLALHAYIDGEINNEILPSKILYVKNYNIGTVFWQQQNIENKNRIQPELNRHITDLAHHFYAQAKKTGKSRDFKRAASWYRTYLKAFAKSQNAAYMNFLLAESLYDARLYKQALAEYEKSAYQYPAHAKSAEAAYAALLTYNLLLKKAQPVIRQQLEKQALSSAIRFSNSFPNNKHAAAVISKTAETLLQLKNYTQASEFAKRIIDSKKPVKHSLQRTAWIVYGHAQFELKDYTEAEKAYKLALAKIPNRGKKNRQLRSQLTDKLAASIYKQAEKLKSAGNNKLAAYHFLRIAKLAPSSAFHATAEYDAATLYILMKEWKMASGILENFRRKFPQQKQYLPGISSKLALSYTEMGQFNKAAKEISSLSSYASSADERRKLLWEAAEMYDRAKQRKQATTLYKKYVKKYPQPFNQSMEAYQRIINYYKNSKAHNRWLRKMIAAEKRGGKYRSERSHYLAASASFELAQPIIKRFQKVKLKIPLKKSLRNKKRRMKAAIKSLKKVMSYRVAEFTTAATYHMGEIYNQLARSLMDSQRPARLSADELEQYEILLEEQAYPFEEKSIKIHSSNIKRTQQGVYDQWIKKSMTVLAEIQPVRYAKREKIEPYVYISH